MLRSRVAALLILPALIACGGGGSGSPAVAVPPSANSSPTPVPQSATAKARFILGGSGATIASRGRRLPRYLAPTTRSIAIGYTGVSFPDVLNLDPTSSNCSGTSANLVCSIDVTVPIGNVLFTVAAYDQPNATGNRLSLAQVPATIVAGTNVVHATLQGIVNSLRLGSIDVPMGIATSVPVPLIVKDADGNVIVGPGQYDAAIALSNGDASGTTTLSTTSLSGPGVSASLAYAGHGTPNGSVTASITDPSEGSFASTTGSGGGLIRVVAPTREYALPSGNGTLGPMLSAPDGSLWFGETHAIGRVTTAGAVTEYPLPSNLNGPTALAIGADGDLWFDAGYPNALNGVNAVVQLSAAGTFTAYPVSFATPQRGVRGLALGSDGALWFSADGQLAKIDRFGTITTVTTPLTPAGGTPQFGDAVTGPDGNVWFTENAQGDLARVTPAGVTTYFPMPVTVGGFYNDNPWTIVVTPDGHFDVAASSGTLYRVDTNGTIVVTASSAVEPYGGIAITSDGTVWTILGSDLYAGSVVGHLTSTGLDRITVAGQPGAVFPNDLVALHAGADGNLWYLRGSHVGTIVLH